MSNENTLHRHELHVIFEEGENSVITWTVDADETIERASDMSYDAFTAAGAPLAALGIKVLQQLLCEQVVELALNKAENHRWRNFFRRNRETAQEQPAQWEKPELRLIH